MAKVHSKKSFFFFLETDLFSFIYQTNEFFLEPHCSVCKTDVMREIKTVNFVCLLGAGTDNSKPRM